MQTRHDEAHIVEFFVGEEIIEGEVIQEALSGIDAIAILVVIGCVVGIRNDQHIILLGFGPHGVIADDDLPVAAPIVPADQDGLALRQCLILICAKVIDTKKEIL